MAGEWPLVGRDAELQRLRSFVVDEQSSGVIVAGPPGVGKTRLAVECLKIAERAGLAVARVTATRATANLPFGALAPLLPADDHGAGEAGDPVALFRSSADALVERAAGHRLFLLVDDAHLLDDASATVIYHLAGTTAACLFATVRTGEPAPESVVGLWKDGLVERVELVGLDGPAVEALLERTLEGPVDPAGVAQLFGRCQGNVLFLRELVLGALDDGTLQNDGGIWRLVGPLLPSQRLAELVDIRMGRLADAERRLLEAMALGEPLGPSELEALADPAVLEDLVEKGLLISRRDRRRLEVRLAHPLYGDVLRSRIPALRLPKIARSLAEAVEATGARRREDTLRVATWSFEAGIPRPDLMLAAAKTARWRYDFPLAERLALAALDDGAGFEAELLAAQLACLRGRAAEAERKLALLADQAETDAQRGIVAVNRIDTLGVYKGWMGQGLQLAEQMEGNIADPAWRDEITARRAIMLLATEGPQACIDLALPLVSRAKGRALVWACIGASFALARLGRIAEALQLVDRGHSEHVVLIQPIDRYPWLHAWLRCEALVHGGRLQEAEEHALAQYEQGVSEASAEQQAYFAWHLATVVGDRGHTQTAARYAREGMALNRELGRPHYVGECLVGLTLALALSGQGRAAGQALAAYEALQLPDSVFKPLELALARGWVAVAAAEPSRGVELFRTAASEAGRRGDLVGEAAALHSQARVDRPSDVVARLEELAGVVEGDLTAARASHVRALVDRDPDGLLKASSDFELMGADLLAAEAAADAVVALRRAGDPRAATATQRRVDVLRERCEGAITPALQAAGIRAQLTRSERRAAVMAAAGQSNSEIAGILCLSVRTIENHLRRVYEKLGISGRAELAAALGSDTEDATA